MNIGIIDAEIVGKNKHRFPNLASMKISSYHKSIGDTVSLLIEYSNLDMYDKVYISKVFTETFVPDEVVNMKNVVIGGTGFFYDKAEPLPDEIEHIMPDYDLYNDWVGYCISKGFSKKQFEYYTDYSIGFTTRGCFRKCEFCVNRNSKVVSKHSEIEEFLDVKRKKICLLDDNILGYGRYEEVFEKLNSLKKKFQYKQGMDIRILTDRSAKILSESNYYGDYIFAFDNIADSELIESKLELWRKYNDIKHQNTKLYVFCAFDRNDKWDLDFWNNDIVDLFKRIQILMKYNCKPYVMKFARFEESPFRGMYINIARWCNQPSLFFKMSYEEMCEKDNEYKGGNSATKRYNDFFRKESPKIAEKYFNIKCDVFKEDV